jgi:tellurite resistance protein TerC
VLVLVEATDLIFAIDSIPAIFGISRDPFVVFTSNIFAVMGLRSLFFLLASVVTKFHLLKYGLAVILTFVGAKMLLEHWIHIPIMLSLGIVVAVLGASIVASLVWPQLGRTCEGKTGSMFGTIPRNGGG